MSRNLTIMYNLFLQTGWTNRMDKVSCKVLDISPSYVTRLCTEPLFSFRQENGLAHRAFVKGHGASKPYQKVG